ncbi:MAG TPA: ATP-binding protein [Gemmatimonadaceae bacterium]
MRLISLTTAEVRALAERLATYDSMSSLPLIEREWLVTNGELRAYEEGEKLVAVPDEAQEMIVVLSGRVVVYFGHGGGRRHSMESLAGSLSGVLPYSRLKRPQWDVLVEAPTELIAIHRDRFPAMIRDCPVLTESLVHAMLDRTRRFAAANWGDEKVMSLGRLAAGLAHELNNPAAAAASGAKRLARALADIGDAAQAVGAAPLNDDQRARVNALVERCQRPLRTVALSPIERADTQERVAEWLDRHELDAELATTLVDGGVGLDELEPLVPLLSDEALAAAARWVAAAAAAAVVAADLERATRRVSDVVSALRGYTYMDRAPVREPTDVGRGLTDTVEVMRAEANRKGAAVRLDVAPELPLVSAVGPDLNQAWANLLQNALDAVSSGGEVVVIASAVNGSVVVRVIDDGPGIAPEVRPRIFDPFFTTKPAGAGVGLGLDIVRRVVRSHAGDVEFETEPGRTEFRVRLPLAATTS